MPLQKRLRDTGRIRPTEVFDAGIPAGNGNPGSICGLILDRERNSRWQKSRQNLSCNLSKIHWLQAKFQEAILPGFLPCQAKLLLAKISAGPWRESPLGFLPISLPGGQDLSKIAGRISQRFMVRSKFQEAKILAASYGGMNLTKIENKLMRMFYFTT